MTTEDEVIAQIQKFIEVGETLWEKQAAMNEELVITNELLQIIVIGLLSHASVAAIADVVRDIDAKIDSLPPETAKRFRQASRELLGVQTVKPARDKFDPDRHQFTNWVENFPVPFSDRFKTAHLRAD